MSTVALFGTVLIGFQSVYLNTRKNIHILIFKNPLLYSAKWGSKSLCAAETCFCTAESAKFEILVCAKPSRYRCRKQVHPFEEHFLEGSALQVGELHESSPIFDGSAVQVEELHEKNSKTGKSSSDTSKNMRRGGC